MKIKPGLEQLRSIAAEGRYRYAPVAMELLSDIRTPIEVLRILQTVSDHCFLLESAREQETWGRWTFLGYDPSLEITCLDGHLKIGSMYLETDDPGSHIRRMLKEHTSAVIEGLPPFTGGLVGYFSYDYIKYSEPVLRLDAEDNEGFQDVDLMLFEKLIAFDNFRQKIFLIVNVQLDDTETGYKQALKQLRQMEELILNGVPGKNNGGRITGEIRPLFDKAQFCGMVEKAKRHIFEGDIFQAVLSNRLEAPFEGSLLDTYRILRTVNPSPYMFYLSGADLEAAGASPETLIRLENGILHTFPLAGTRPRGKTVKEDLELEKELLKDPKELAEHSMLVDLGRNDLGKISRFGSVEVEEAYTVQRYSHVMHIGSTVRGEIRDGADALDAVDAVLPAGTLSGAPKIRACQLINELENNKRGIYGGALGYISLTGNMDLCIAIRLAFRKNGKVFVRSGAGIVADSVPEKEYEECINKAAAVMKSLEEAGKIGRKDEDEETLYDRCPEPEAGNAAAARTGGDSL